MISILTAIELWITNTYRYIYILHIQVPLNGFGFEVSLWKPVKTLIFREKNRAYMILMSNM